MMPLDRLREWCVAQGRGDLFESKTARELAVVDKVAQIAFALEAASPALPAQSSIKTASFDVGFTMPIEGKKKPVHFCQIAFQSTFSRWARKAGRIPPETVRVYLQLSKKRTDASPIKEIFEFDDTGRWREEWHFVEVTPAFDLESQGFAAAIEDAYDTLRYQM
ncbi:MAG: hypothetical protein HYR85_17210 [Planctomycetes bacterium]|nr:hypothetical protein [Planctomycetota bacterium]MBI3845380.1 hypothetical protein [Planctomycetota bacterium]